MKTGLTFVWESGSRNSNAIALFKQLGIEWEYNHFLELTADFYGIGLFEKVEFEQVGDAVEICRA